MSFLELSVCEVLKVYGQGCDLPLAVAAAVPCVSLNGEQLPLLLLATDAEHHLQPVTSLIRRHLTIDSHLIKCPLAWHSVQTTQATLAATIGPILPGSELRRPSWILLLYTEATRSWSVLAPISLKLVQCSPDSL